MRSPRSTATIDLAALVANASAVRRHVGPRCSVIAVLKANAYGHGAVECAQALEPLVEWIAVATVAEASELRVAGIQSPIMTLSPLLPEEADLAVEARVAPIIDSEDVADALGRASEARNLTTSVHLKVDTGMSRVGVLPANAVPVAAHIIGSAGVRLAGICSHFACSEDDREFTERQLALFTATATQIERMAGHPLIKHIASSAATVILPSSHLDAVRVGCLLYGIHDCDLALHPVLSWTARVTSLRHVPAGTLVSYGATYQTAAPATIATLPIGYADGYLRTLSNRGVVAIGGVEAPIVGRVCMDQLMVDVTGIGVNIGDAATLIGGRITVPRLATLANTTVHEITTIIGRRVERRTDHG